MKQLVLARHAKSSWKDATLADYDRPLNKRGRRDLPFMAARLAEREPAPQLIWASPAKRTALTAEGYADALGIPASSILWDERLYYAGGNSMVALLGALDDDIDSVMIVGHNPALTLAANTLAGWVTDNLPTSGQIGLRAPDWTAPPGKWRLGFFDYPKRYAELAQKP
jgi:phosphohistidine phosphatase